MHQSEPEEKTFFERAGWPLWLWLFLLFLAASLSLAFWAALGNGWALGTLGVQLVALGYGAMRTPLRIEVKDGVVTVGVARLPLEFISGVKELSSREMQQMRGPAVNPSAYPAIRFWVSTGVQITISDPQDPTPYWLVSCKNAHQLVEALIN